MRSRSLPVAPPSRPQTPVERPNERLPTNGHHRPVEPTSPSRSKRPDASYSHVKTRPRAVGSVEVTDRRAALDYAQLLKALSDTHFPTASKIVLVQDNLNTHKPASLYQAFPPAEAHRLVERFEWHYTPKHGSWLDMAESELSILSVQCLDRRIPDRQTLIEEVAAWQNDRNKNHTKADWHFTTADARIKLKRLYPAV